MSIINVGGGGILAPVIDNLVCPITVEDVAKTRGSAFLNLNQRQQKACGGFNGYIYQEGLKRAYEKGKSQGMSEIDLSDNMIVEDAKIAWNNLGVKWKNFGIDNPILQVVLYVLGFVLGFSFIKSIFFD